MPYLWFLWGSLKAPFSKLLSHTLKYSRHLARAIKKYFFIVFKSICSPFISSVGAASPNLNPLIKIMYSMLNMCVDGILILQKLSIIYYVLYCTLKLFVLLMSIKCSHTFIRHQLANFLIKTFSSFLVFFLQIKIYCTNF